MRLFSFHLVVKRSDFKEWWAEFTGMAQTCLIYSWAGSGFLLSIGLFSHGILVVWNAALGALFFAPNNHRDPLMMDRESIGFWMKVIQLLFNIWKFVFSNKFVPTIVFGHFMYWKIFSIKVSCKFVKCIQVGGIF